MENNGCPAAARRTSVHPATMGPGDGGPELLPHTAGCSWELALIFRPGGYFGGVGALVLGGWSGPRDLRSARGQGRAKG